MVISTVKRKNLLEGALDRKTAHSSIIVMSCHKYQFCHDKRSSCCDKHMFVVTKHVFCHDKSMLVMTKLLSQETYFCCNKSFVMTNICSNKHNFVRTKLLSRQAYFCRDKHVLVVTKHILSWQKYAFASFCHDKSFVTTNICSNKHNFVTTKLLSRQAHFCRDKHVFVATKHIFCHNKSMLVTTKLVTTNTCLVSRQIFVATKVWSWQKMFVSRNKSFVVAASIVLRLRLTKRVCCRDKNYTCGSSRQWYSSVSEQRPRTQVRNTEHWPGE